MDTKAWEPVEALQVMALDSDCMGAQDGKRCGDCPVCDAEESLAEAVRG